MIIEYIRYQIPKEIRDAFLGNYLKAAEALRASPYCMGYELTNGVEEPENFILRIKWTSTDEHLNGFRRSEEFKMFYAEVAPFFSNIQEMKHYEFTEVYWTR